MPTLNIFSIPLEVKFKTRLFTITTLVVFILIAAALLLPLIIAYQAGGFWLKNRVYVESPRIRFLYKYLLVAERSFDVPPIVCSTFPTYNSIPIKDDCAIVKVREEDVNKDKQKDSLKFTTNFWTDQPIKSVKLLLWFEFQLKDIIEHNAETVAIIDAVLPHDSQKLSLTGDLKLSQKGIIRRDYFAEVSKNETIETVNYSLDEVVSHYARKMFSTQLVNIYTIWQTGFANDMPVTISVEIFYTEQPLHYQPCMWEELKWAWIQYLSLFFITINSIRGILKYFFTRGRLRSYVMVPWKDK